MTPIRSFPSNDNPAVRWWVAGLLFVALVVLREPAYLLAPRIWAEEGGIYAQAWLDAGGALAALFMPHLGYYSLVPTLAVQLGMGLGGLEYLPYVTTGVAMLMMAACLAAPFVLPGRLWCEPWKPYALLFFALILSPGEIWLNSITTQFYLGLFGVYLLLCDQAALRGWRLLYASAMLLVAVLTGVTATVLLPFFAMQAWRARHLGAKAWLWCAILLLGLVLQVVAHLLDPGGDPGANRFSLANLGNFPRGFGYVMVFPVNAQWKGGWIKEVVQGAAGVALLLFWWAALRQGGEARRLLLLAVYLAAVFAALSIGMGGGPRYAYPVAMVLVLILFRELGEAPRKGRRLAMVLLLLMLAVKLPAYFSTRKYYDPEWPTHASELARLNAGQQDHIRVFPRWKNADWRIVVRRAPKAVANP